MGGESDAAGGERDGVEGEAGDGDEKGAGDTAAILEKTQAYA